MNIFIFNDYKEYIVKRIKLMPHGGRGQYKELAKFLGIHNTLISQILKGVQNFNLEQAFRCCNFFGLNELEIEYFLLLINKERSGTSELKIYYEKQIARVKLKSKKVSENIPKFEEITEEDKIKFYSHWYYSAIRLMTSIEGYHSVDAISEYLKLPKFLVSEVLNFLVQKELCYQKDGKSYMGSQRTHIGADHNLVYRHHANWRLKCIERFQQFSSDDLFYTSPLTIAKSDIPKIKDIIVKTISKVSHIVKDSPSEKLMCLNIDWTEIK